MQVRRLSRGGRPDSPARSLAGQRPARAPYTPPTPQHPVLAKLAEIEATLFGGDALPLKRGDRVVITHYDEERNVVSVEPVDRLTHVRTSPTGAREGEAAEEPVAPAKRRGASDSR